MLMSWVGLFFFFGGGRLPSYKSLGRGWDVIKLPGLSQKRSSKARVRPISWWNTYLQDISNNPFNSPHQGCLSRSSTSQGSPPGLPREPLQPPLRPMASIQAKFSTAQWHLKYKQTSLKDPTIPVSLLASLHMHYRSFNDLRQNQSIEVLFQLKVLYFTFTAAS